MGFLEEDVFGANGVVILPKQKQHNFNKVQSTPIHNI